MASHPAIPGVQVSSDIIFQPDLAGVVRVPVHNHSDVGVCFDEQDLVSSLEIPGYITPFNASTFEELKDQFDPEDQELGEQVLGCMDQMRSESAAVEEKARAWSDAERKRHNNYLDRISLILKAYASPWFADAQAAAAASIRSGQTAESLTGSKPGLPPGPVSSKKAERIAKERDAASHLAGDGDAGGRRSRACHESTGDDPTPITADGPINSSSQHRGGAQGSKSLHLSSDAASTDESVQVVTADAQGMPRREVISIHSSGSSLGSSTSIQLGMPEDKKRPASRGPRTRTFDGRKRLKPKPKSKPAWEQAAAATRNAAA